MSTSCYAVFLELSVPSNKRTSDFECCPVYVGTFEASNPGELASLLTFTVLKGSEYEHGRDCVTWYLPVDSSTYYGHDSEMRRLLPHKVRTAETN